MLYQSVGVPRENVHTADMNDKFPLHAYLRLLVSGLRCWRLGEKSEFQDVVG